MNKIFLIIRREYLTRVRKRSFVVMTILGPILMALIFILPVYLATRQDEKRQIQVIDETGWFAPKFENTGNYQFIPISLSLEEAKKNLGSDPNSAVLYIPATHLSVPDKAVIYSDDPPTLNLKGYITNTMSREIEKHKLAAEIRKEILHTSPGLQSASDTAHEDLMSETILKNIHTDVDLTSIKVSEGGTEQKSYTEAYMIAGWFFSFLIYMFIFLFGAQVMRGVIEEKTNRIVEVIVSSVKPFQLMLGKIVGVAMVGLTQFILWVLFTATIIITVQQAFPEKFKVQGANNESSISSQVNPQQAPNAAVIQAQENGDKANVVLDAISSINFPVLISAFIFYFIGGYLLYGALFAAIGSAVDNETDTQQFMLPITVPLIFAFVVAQSVINNPQGSMAIWLSMIPFTSPVIMMVRIPFGVPYWQLATSMVLLIAGFMLTTWVASRIYRTGILMYGKKVNYHELWKWIRYRG
ncbi:MAG: ABC transporter permease [Bacteroidetes bacterium]|nr:ABC transporter permease [Bacteroidota bacterium]